MEVLLVRQFSKESFSLFQQYSGDGINIEPYILGKYPPEFIKIITKSLSSNEPVYLFVLVHPYSFTVSYSSGNTAPVNMINVSKFVSGEYSYDQLQCIAYALSQEIPETSTIFNPSFSDLKIQYLTELLLTGADVDSLNLLEYTSKQLSEILNAVIQQVDYTLLSTPSYTEDQMRVIRKLIKNDSKVAGNKVSIDEIVSSSNGRLALIELELDSNIQIRSIFNQRITTDQVSVLRDCLSFGIDGDIFALIADDRLSGEEILQLCIYLLQEQYFKAIVNLRLPGFIDKGIIRFNESPTTGNLARHKLALTTYELEDLKHLLTFSYGPIFKNRDLIDLSMNGGSSYWNIKGRECFKLMENTKQKLCGESRITLSTFTPPDYSDLVVEDNDFELSEIVDDELF